MLVRLMVTLVKQRDERFAAKSLDGKWSPGRLLPTTAYRLNPTLPITGCTLPITASRGTGAFTNIASWSIAEYFLCDMVDWILKELSTFFYIPIENKSIPT